MKEKPMKLIDGILFFQCPSCKEFKDKSYFYRDNRSPNGIKSECKKCHCERTIRSRDTDIARQNNREWQRLDRENNPEKYREIWRKRKRIKNKKTIARDILNKAVINGFIEKPMACSDCGNITRLAAHHSDYNKPLEVEWLCYECHGKRHRKIISTVGMGD